VPVSGDEFLSAPESEDLTSSIAVLLSIKRSLDPNMKEDGTERAYVL